MAYTTIDDPSEYFQTTLYTGDGANSHAITNTGNSDLQPDWLWIKRRDGAVNHLLHDSVRGVTNLLVSNTNAGDDSNSNIVLGFDSDGFRVGANSASNGNNQTFVAWQWKETATAGFDIVSYTGTGSARTISHSLSAVPKWMIVKKRSGEDNWNVYHEAMGNTHFMSLNEDGAKEDSAARWNDTTPTSSVFTVGTDDRVNTNTATYIAYLFAEKKGYSKFGSYTGNGNANGPFIFTGFKPAFIMFKRTNATNDWFMLDNKIHNFNKAESESKMLRPNLNSVEQANNIVDLLSNGFKARNTNDAYNNNDSTYIYMAFAENPFVTSGGVPTTAR